MKGSRENYRPGTSESPRTGGIEKLLNLAGHVLVYHASPF